MEEPTVTTAPVIATKVDQPVEQIEKEEENFDTKSIDSLETHSDPNLDQNVEPELTDTDVFHGFGDVDDSASRVKLAIVEIDKNGNTFGMRDYLADDDTSDSEDMAGLVEIMFSQELLEHYIKLLKDDKASLAALRKVSIHRPVSPVHPNTSLQCGQLFTGLKEVEDEFVADSLHHYEVSATVKTPKRVRKTPAKLPATKKIATPRGRKSAGGKQQSVTNTNLMMDAKRAPDVFPLPPSPLSSPSEGNRTFLLT